MMSEYKCNAVLFGLPQAPAYFQQLLSIVLQDCSDLAMAYLDDIIIIFSQNEQEHLKHIEIIFKKLKKAGLKSKESKCDFFKKETHYLGHFISVNGIQPLPEKAGQHLQHAKTQVSKRNKTISWFDRLLQKIHSAISWYG